MVNILQIFMWFDLSYLAEAQLWILNNDESSVNQSTLSTLIAWLIWVYNYYTSGSNLKINIPNQHNIHHNTLAI